MRSKQQPLNFVMSLSRGEEGREEKRDWVMEYEDTGGGKLILVVEFV